MRIIYCHADSPQEWNCSAWRCKNPSDVFNARGHTANLLWLPAFANFNNPAIQDLVGPADLIVVQRNFFRKEIWDAMDYWRGQGKAVVADLDDGYPLLPWSNFAHAFWLENSQQFEKPPIELLIEGFKHCDALTSPSKVILDDWKEQALGLHVPNYAPRSWYRNLGQRSPKKNPDKIVLGWGGSMSHYDSWWFSNIKPALKKVCERHSEVQVKICGNDERLFGQLDVPSDQKIFQPGVAPEKWSEIIATFDIGLAPLDLRDRERSYDNRRSWIKGAEYMLAGVPWIASRAAPYEELKDYGSLVENSSEAWEEAIEETLDHLPQARESVRSNRQWAVNNLTLENNLYKIIETYERALLLSQSPRLPGLISVPSRESTWTEEPEKEIGLLTDSLRAEIQSASFALASSWHGGLLSQEGDADLGYGLRYDLLQRLNREFLSSKGLLNEQ